MIYDPLIRNSCLITQPRVETHRGADCIKITYATAEGLTGRHTDLLNLHYPAVVVEEGVGEVDRVPDVGCGCRRRR